jgi:hypothetical protein
MQQPEARGFRGGGRGRWAVTAALAGLLAFGVYAAVTEISDAVASDDGDYAPAKVEPLNGSGVSRLVLDARAVERLGLKTAPVVSVRLKGGARSAVPYSAVVYDEKGVAWTYVTLRPLTFVRHRLVVDRVAGGRALLRKGPRVGTQVVTVGGAELFGAEIDFGKG